MKFKALCLAVTLPLLFAVQVAKAESSMAVQQMANVLLKMDKAPNKAQKATLEDITNSSAATANEQNLAKAILTIDGNLKSENKKLVWDVLRSISAAEGERVLAKVVNQFNQAASEDEKRRLTTLLPPPPAPKKNEGVAKK